MKTATAMIVPALFVALFFSGCCSWRPKPVEPMSIEDAMASLGRGFVAMKTAQLEAYGGKEFNTGLVPSEAEVVFNVSKATTKDGKLLVELAPNLPGSPVSGKFGMEGSSAKSSSAANTITVRFKSIIFATTSTATTKAGDTIVTVEGITDPDMLANIFKVLKDAGVQIRLREPFIPDSEQPDSETK